MTQKTKPGSEALLLKLRQSNDSWEHQEKTVYTVEALEKDIKEKLSPKKGASEEDSSE
jgi:hypothetical protein